MHVLTAPNRRTAPNLVLTTSNLTHLNTTPCKSCCLSVPLSCAQVHCKCAQVHCKCKFAHRNTLVLTPVRNHRHSQRPACTKATLHNPDIPAPDHTTGCAASCQRPLPACVKEKRQRNVCTLLSDLHVRRTAVGCAYAFVAQVAMTVGRSGCCALGIDMSVALAAAEEACASIA